MTSPVPRWVIADLFVVCVVVISAGIAAEGTRWATGHPFTINLLSSVGGFAGSAVFGSLIINRLARRRYWPAELDARTTTAREAERLLRDILSLFGETTAAGSPNATLGRLLADLHRSGGTEEVSVRSDLFGQVEAALGDLQAVESRFSFLEDPELIYRVNRLKRKGKDLLQEWHSQAAEDRRPGVASIGAIETAIQVVDAAMDLRSWAHSAPDRRMRAAVADRAYRSDLD